MIKLDTSVAAGQIKFNLHKRSVLPLIGLCLFLGLSSCKDELAWKQNQFKKTELLQSTSDPQLPEILWRHIEAVFTGVEVTEPAKDSDERKTEVDSATKPAEKAGEGTEGGGSSRSAEIEKGGLPTEFAPLKIYLIEKNHGVLHGVNHEIIFGAGGGEIDLQDFVESKKGSFYFAAEFMPDVPIEKGSPGRKIFFLSNSVRRHNKLETIGNGCHNYYDITTSFEQAMTDRGFMLNTTDARHVSALAGTFFFAVKNDGKLFLAQLTIKDSGQRALQCRH